MSQQTSEQLITAAEAARLKGVHGKTFLRWGIHPVVALPVSE